MGRRRLVTLLLVFAAWSLVLPGRASVALYVTPEELAACATLVVEGQVRRTASGFDPVSGTLSTYVTIEVRTIHRGPPGLRQVIVREPGGAFGTLAHEVPAAPDYRPGERVIAFLEPASDGALRTVAMLFGKYEIRRGPRGSERAARVLEGARILGGPAKQVEQLPLADLTALTEAIGPRAADSSDRPSWRAVPDELPRLQWQDVGRFADLDPSFPARWIEPDRGRPIAMHVDPAGDPLGDPAAALDQIGRAMSAWAEVPESRVEIRVGDPAFDYTATHDRSPAVRFSGTNAILFGDPYDDISGSTTCSGLLATGGYWRSTSEHSVVNSVSFSRILQGYVIFNDGMECFLRDPENLAEVAAHELGHVLGLGHSGAFDSIMRWFAYGGRGPRLGDDDEDAAHCRYPHTLRFRSPRPGQTLAASTLQDIVWSSTPEFGSPGTVDLQYTLDGVVWHPLAAGVANDGSYPWLVPTATSDRARLRLLRPNRVDPPPGPFPAACSGAITRGTFSIADEPTTERPGNEALPDRERRSRPLVR